MYLWKNKKLEIFVPNNDKKFLKFEELILPVKEIFDALLISLEDTKKLIEKSAFDKSGRKD